MKERDVLNTVTALLDLFGWRWWHVPAPMLAGRDGNWHAARGAKGLPDIFALHADPPRMLILELKGSTGKLSDEQREFLSMARDVAEAPAELLNGWTSPALARNIGVYVVEPSNLDAIEQIIRSAVLT